MQAQLPEQLRIKRLGWFEVGDRGWVECKAMFADASSDLWLDPLAEALAAEDKAHKLRVTRAPDGYRVEVHDHDYRWKPGGGASNGHLPVVYLAT